MIADPYTGKALDCVSDALPVETKDGCEHCGTHIINRCPRCGAPQCCPRCCLEAEREATEYKP